MESQARGSGCVGYQSCEEDVDVKKGPWTVEEDRRLVSYINIHGEGRWNTAARCSGLKRTGKSCRLRWLNYLRPDVRRGNMSLQEQLMILELHSRWGNRWSKIAQELPGRTDNEIKNYWRTRVQKQAKHLRCDVNSKQFREAMRYVWIPRLVERIRAASDSSAVPCQPSTDAINPSCTNHQQDINVPAASTEYLSEWVYPSFNPDVSGTLSDSLDTQVSPVSDLTAECHQGFSCNYYPDTAQNGSGFYPGNGASYQGWYDYQQEVQDIQAMEQQSNIGLAIAGESVEDMWNEENILFLQQHLMS